METENTKVVIQQESQLAKWSVCLSLCGWILTFGCLSCFAFPIWLVATVLGITGLVQMKNRPRPKGKSAAILGITISIIPLIFLPILTIHRFLSSFTGEPFDESHPITVIDAVKKYSDYQFPQQMSSIKAADRIARGIDNPYMFIICFTTTQEYFTNLQKTLSESEKPEYITESLSNGSYDPRQFVLYDETPDWYKTFIKEGSIYKSEHIYTKNSVTITFTSFYVLLKDSNDIAVYIEGWGNSKIKKNRNPEEK